MRFAGVVLVLAVAIGFAGPVLAADPADLADDPSELMRTWDRAWLALPGSDEHGQAVGPMASENVRAALDRIPSDTRLPVLVFLHGCTGIEIEEGNVEELATGLGIAVVFPNSFARNVRERNCDPGEYSDGQFPAAYPYRWAEARFARARLAQLPWVDQDRVFLGGFSEGAIATALYDRADYAAYLVMGWTCQSPRPWMAGLRLPADATLLTVVMDRDPWTDWPGWRGDCGTWMADRPRARSIVIDGSGHGVLSYPEARRAVREFLGAAIAPQGG